MNSTPDFLEAYRDFMESINRSRPLSPTGLVGQWSSFVEDCEDCYGDNIYEFHNDLQVRGLIEELLQSSELARFEQMGWVRAEVDAIDDRYRALLIDHDVQLQVGASWWEARVPRLAGRELAAEFKSRYGLDVETCD